MEKKETPPQIESVLDSPYASLPHDKTESEDRYTVLILRILKEDVYSGDIHCRCFLVNQFGKVRRPDFYLPKYGLAIEIDGDTRHSQPSRNNDLQNRDKFYTDLGAYPVLAMKSTDIMSESKMISFKHRLKEFLYTERITPQRRKLINKRISEGRKKIGIFKSQGSLAPQFLEELAREGFKEYRHFGGTRLILKAKYRTAPKLKLDFSPYGIMKNIFKEKLKSGEITNGQYLSLLRKERQKLPKKS